MNSGLKERMGTHEDEMYAFARAFLHGGGDFRKFKEVVPEAVDEIVEAIRVLRRNQPKYREVKIPGLDGE